MKEGRILNVAIAQDAGENLYSIRELIAEVYPHNRIISLFCGQQLLDYLHKKGTFLSEPFPDIIFLDFNKPLVDYSEALKEMSLNSQFNQIPVYILYGNLFKVEIKKVLGDLINKQIT